MACARRQDMTSKIMRRNPRKDRITRRPSSIVLGTAVFRAKSAGTATVSVDGASFVLDKKARIFSSEHKGAHDFPYSCSVQQTQTQNTNEAPVSASVGNEPCRPRRFCPARRGKCAVWRLSSVILKAGTRAPCQGRSSRHRRRFLAAARLSLQTDKATVGRVSGYPGEALAILKTANATRPAS